jgi:hypothetical protein
MHDPFDLSERIVLTRRLVASLGVTGQFQRSFRVLKLGAQL